MSRVGPAPPPGPQPPASRRHSSTQSYYTSRPVEIESADMSSQSRDPKESADDASFVRTYAGYEIRRSSYVKAPHIPAVRFAAGDLHVIMPVSKDDKRMPMKPILSTGIARTRLSPSRAVSIPMTAGRHRNSVLSASVETSFVAAAAAGVAFPPHISRRLTDSQLVGQASQWQSSKTLGSQWPTSGSSGSQWTGSRAVPAARYARQGSLSQLSANPRYSI
jgi:hypothetical protein